MDFVMSVALRLYLFVTVNKLFYCGEQHLKEDWPNHKKDHKMYEHITNRIDTGRKSKQNKNLKDDM